MARQDNKKISRESRSGLPANKFIGYVVLTILAASVLLSKSSKTPLEAEKTHQSSPDTSDTTDTSPLAGSFFTRWVKRTFYKLAGAFVVAALAINALLSWASLKSFLDGVDASYSVAVSGIENISLNAGPVAFLHKDSHLYYRGTIDEKTKLALIGLFPKHLTTVTDLQKKENECGLAADSKMSCTQIERNYLNAVDQLAYLSNENRSELLLKLLLTGACFGALGSTVRSVSAYVNHRSRGDLDLSKWSPYYYARPFNGAIFGVIVVVIVKAGFLTANHTETDSTLWWVSLAFFAGFADREFGEKVRQISLALFGESRAKTSAEKTKENI